VARVVPAEQIQHATRILQGWNRRRKRLGGSAPLGFVGAGAAHEAGAVHSAGGIILGGPAAGAIGADAARSLGRRLLIATRLLRVFLLRLRIFVAPLAGSGFVGPLLVVIPAENPAEIFGILKPLGDDRAGVGVRQHVFLEPLFLRQDVVDQPAEERDVGAGADLHVQVGARTGPAESRIDMNERRAALARLHWPAEAHRVGLSHVRAHDQDAVAVGQILLIPQRSAATEGGAQTG